MIPRPWHPLIAAITTLTLTAPAAADWPMQAHDPQRTATSPGRADLADPIVTWSYSLGNVIVPPVSRNRMPVAAAFDGRADDVLATFGGGELARLDVSNATRVEPARVRWTWAGAVHPTLWDLTGDGIYEVIAYDGDAVEARDARNLNLLFRTVIAAAGQVPHRAVVPGRDARDPHGVRLHALVRDNVIEQGSIVTLTSLGRIDWQSPWWNVRNLNTGIPTPDDPTGTGTDLVLVGLGEHMRVLHASDGHRITGTLNNFPEYITSVRGRAGQVTHLVTAGVDRFRAIAVEGVTPTVRVIYGLQFDSEENGLSILDCPDGHTVAIGTHGGSHRVHRFDIADGQHHHFLHLAAGRDWPNPEAVPLQHQAVRLGPTSGIAALYADQPAVVVGSTDGHLYAVDPCPQGPPRLLWSLDLGAAVGTPIFADTDGDNLEEIVVATADGMLHGIDTLRTPPPDFIHDLDDPNGAADLDETHRPHLETLHAAWAPVPGARAYEYTFLDANGPCGPFTPTNDTHGEDLYCELIPGTRYAVAARAIGPLGTSPEAISDGIRWLPCPDADGDGHCAADDCDDTDPNLPAAADQCTAQGMPDGIDDDCDGVVDEGCPCTDLDADGHCPPADCDDADPAIPTASDRCTAQGMPDGIDDDCDGLIDEDCPCLDGPAPEEPNGADDDCDGAIDEGCVEERANGIDDDCDTHIDEGFTCGPDDTDDDEDGVCALFDCDDRDPTRAPGLEDTCHDGRDQDCDGRPDEGCPCLDTDEDGACDPDDCRPEDPTMHPAADELCHNGLDDDCDGRPDEGCRRATPASGGCDCAIATPGHRPAPAALVLVLLLALTRPRRRP